MVRTVSKLPNGLSPAEMKMAKMLPQLNFGLAGDVGAFTVWTTQRGKLVIIKRAPPDKPPSVKQFKQRARFRLTVQQWRGLPENTRKTWNELADRLGICASGMNLYMSLCFNPDPETLSKKCSQYGLTLQHPEYVGA